MNNECTNRNIGDKLFAYEMGMLSEEESREFEEHLIDCPHCCKLVEEFMETSRLLRTDDDVKAAGRRLSLPDSSTADTSAPIRKKRSRITAIIPAAAVVIAAVLLLVLRPWHVQISPTSDAVAVENRVMIAYFDNIADPEDEERLGEIAANLLITDLSGSQFVSVVSSQRLYDLLKLLGQEGEKVLNVTTASEVASRARAHWLLVGSILQVEPSIIVTTQLIDVEKGHIEASQRIEGEPEDDIFAVIDKLTVGIKRDLTLPAGASSETDRPVSEVTTSSQEAYKHYLEGQEYMNKFYWPEAENSFQKAVELDTTFAMAYYYLAGLMDKKLIHRAVKYIDRASVSEQYLIRSREALVSGDAPTAIAELESMVKHFPEDKYAYYSLGALEFAEERWELAVGYFNKAIDIDPLFKAAVNMIAYSYNNLGDFNSAIATIDKYISMVEDEANPYDSRGDLFASNEMYEQAMDSYREALRIKPDFRASREKLGELLLYLHRYVEADSQIAFLREADTPYDRSTGCLLTATLSMSQGKFKESLTLLDECIERDSVERKRPWVYSSMADVHLCRALIFRALHKQDEALASMETAMRLYRLSYPGDKTPFAYLVAEYRAEVGNIDDAERIIESDLAESYDVSESGSFGYAYARAAVELAKNNLDSALVYARQCIKIEKSILSMSLLVRINVELGRFEEAESILTEITTKREFWRPCYTTMHTLAYFSLAKVYEELNEPVKAVEYYRKFIGLWEDGDANIPDLIYARSRLEALGSGI